MSSVRKKLPAASPIDDLPPRRRAILAATFEVLMEHGYAGASTLEIATRAKVSKRELYAEFGSKRGLLESLIASTAARMQVPLTDVDVADRRGLLDALVRYGTTALTELTSPAVVAINRVAVAEASGPGAGDLGAILDRSGREPNREALRRLFAEAQAAGLVGAGDPLVMGGQFFSLLIGDLTLRLMLGVERPPGGAEIRGRAAAAAAAVLRLNAPPR